MEHDFIPRTLEAEAGRLLLWSEFPFTWGYTVRPCLGNKTNKNPTQIVIIQYFGGGKEIYALGKQTTLLGLRWVNISFSNCCQGCDPGCNEPWLVKIRMVSKMEN